MITKFTNNIKLQFKKRENHYKITMSEYSYHFSEYNSSEFDYELMENKHICPKNFLFDIPIT